MKVKPRGAFGVVSLICLIIIGAAAAYLSGDFVLFGSRNATKIGCVEQKGTGSWSASYTLLNGKMRRELRLGNSSDELVIDVETESGTLSVEVADKSGRSLFACENMASGTYGVNALGNVIVTVTAKNHKGSFDMR